MNRSHKIVKMGHRNGPICCLYEDNFGNQRAFAKILKTGKIVYAETPDTLISSAMRNGWSNEAIWFLERFKLFVAGAKPSITDRNEYRRRMREFNG